MIELPVENWSDRRMKPNCSHAQMTISSASRDRCTASIEPAARNSRAKSRSETASSELAHGRANFKASAVIRLSIGNEVPASAAAPKRAFVQPRAAVGQPPAVAPQHLDISQQVMAESHRLRRLQVSETRHDRCRVWLRLLDQRRLQRAHVGVQRVDGVPHPQAEVGRHLIVARARGVQPPSRLADNFGQPILDVHVHVFQRAAERQAAFARLLQHLIEPGNDGFAVGLRYDPLARQHRRVRFGSNDVVLDQAGVEVD